MSYANIDQRIKELEEEIADGSEHQIETWEHGGWGVGYGLLAQGSRLEKKRKKLSSLRKVKRLYEALDMFLKHIRIFFRSLGGVGTRR
ncbi:MAG: hypothetical protein HYT93_02235 [Parcubacteria group bacterium]|nr:hypothetical protein [Parcubacteria group bacterium]